MIHLLVLALNLIGGVSASTVCSKADTTCKYFPGDACWPSTASWNALNSTVGGRLIATVPIGTPCHDPAYDEKTCENIQSLWNYATIHMNSSSSVMAPMFANQSCDPFTSESRSCELGNYVRYAVRASSVDDVKAAIDFARTNNIRFVIRNTGHDYHGRSTGAGALSVWTHYLKNMTFIDNYSDPTYAGTAVKIGAGVQGYEIIAAARDQNVVVVGGECPTVGIAGGFTQGGGHSALSTNFGLASDNVLEWEVVTANGEFVTANSRNNTDLFWALKGGGAGTFGVVISMTVKTYPDAVVSGAKLTITMTNNTLFQVWEGNQAFHEALPAMVDAETMVSYYFGSTYFVLQAVTAYNKTKAEVQTVMAPFLAALDALDVVYTVAYTEFDTYYEHYANYFGPLPEGYIKVGTWLHAARFIPRSVAGNMTSLWQQVTDAGATVAGTALDVSSFGSAATTAVHPGWRDALIHAAVALPWNNTAPWNEMLAAANKLTNTVMPLIAAVTPGAGSYANEGDFQHPDFQEEFYASNYDRLLQIKNAIDPDNFFYARIGVGSEAWDVAEDGRMCRASTTVEDASDDDNL